MCPVCIANLALAIAGTTSTGGLTALIVTKLWKQRDLGKARKSLNRSERP